MSYENAPATKMLATHCAACRRPLLDAKSVEVGIGPDCRRRLGFDLDVSEEARAEANKLVYKIALGADGQELILAASRLQQLGFVVLAAKIIERAAAVQIKEANGELHVHTPYCEEATGTWRAIPGRRWDPEEKANVIPSNQRRALFNLLTRHYAGQMCYGPKGAFVVGAA